MKRQVAQPVGYGRIPNSIVRSGLWRMIHPKIKAVYIALLGLLDRTMQYTDTEGIWRVAYGFPTLQRIGKTSGVRVADVSRITDLLEELDLLIKIPCSINRKPRLRYIIRPPEHPIYSRVGYSCERIFSEVGKGWGLTRKWGPSRKTHHEPVRLQTHQSPTRLHSTDTHRPKTSPTTTKNFRRPIFTRPGAPPSHKSTARGKHEAAKLLVPLYTALPPQTWEQHTAQLLADGYRLRELEAAKELAAGVLPHLPPLNGGKGGPAGETVGVPPGERVSRRSWRRR